MEDCIRDDDFLFREGDDDLRNVETGNNDRWLVQTAQFWSNGHVNRIRIKEIGVGVGLNLELSKFEAAGKSSTVGFVRITDTKVS